MRSASHERDVDEGERGDRLRDAILFELEIGSGQVRHRVSLPVGDEHVEFDGVNASAEDGRGRSGLPLLSGQPVCEERPR